MSRLTRLVRWNTIQFKPTTLLRTTIQTHYQSVCLSTTSSANNSSSETLSQNQESLNHNQSVNPTRPQPTITSRVIDVLLGVALGVTLYQSSQWLLDWPEPMPTIQNLINDDPLVREHIGDSPKLSWFWTGTIIPQSNFSVAIPISGSRGKGTVYARGVYDSKSRSWKLVYFQCSIHPLLQKHSLDIPKTMEIGIEPDLNVNAAPRSPLVMPANFDPTLLNKEQYVKYQEFLFKNGLKEWKPESVIETQPVADISSSDPIDSSVVPVIVSPQSAQ